MKHTKKEYIQTGIVLGLSSVISIVIVLVVALATRNSPIKNGPDDSSIDNISFSEFDAKDNILNLMQHQLTLSSNEEAEVTDLLSLSWDDTNHTLNCSGSVSDPTNELIISMDIVLDENYTMNSIIEKLGSEEINPSQYTINSTYLLAEESDDFINKSNYKNDFKEAKISLVGVTQDLNQDHYYFGTYKDNSRCISINGLKFDSSTYEYSKLNIPKTDVSINDAKYVYKLLYIL